MLIVDDTPANLGVVVALLEAHGLHVVVAQDGKEGLQRAAYIVPDLILLDVMMPGMDGFEVCRQLKSLIATRDIPVIFMTALSDTASKLAGFAAGGVDYVTKPLAMEELMARVSTHLMLHTTKVSLDRQNQKLEREASVRQQTEGTLQQANEELKNVYKRLEQAKIQLMNSAKMAAYGTLACSSAQRMGEPIVSAKSSLGKLESALASPAQRAQDLLPVIAELKEEFARIEKFAATFQNVFIAGEPCWQTADVGHLLEGTLDMLAERLRTKATIERDFADLPSIECRPAELAQVFASILLNAVQAIPDAGEIRVATGIDKREIWIEVVDNGIGIAPDMLTRIFDPFFTTRPAGKGAGLGLSLSFAAVKRHRGRIEVNSTPGAGSAFRIWLPLQQPSSSDET